MAIVLLLKSFPDHHGRPGHRGGSAPRSNKGGLLPLVECDPDIIGGTDRKSARNRARAYAREHFRGTPNVEGAYPGITVTNQATGHEIIIAAHGVKKATAHCSWPGIGEEDLDHYRMIPALPDLLRAAKPSGAAVSDEDERASIRAVYNMEVKLKMGGETT